MNAPDFRAMREMYESRECVSDLLTSEAIADVKLTLDCIDELAAALRALLEREVSEPTPNKHVDALILPCAKCGTVVPFDYVVDDMFWQTFVPQNQQRDVLCLPCLDSYAGGIPREALHIVYYSGRAGTIPLAPTTAAKKVFARLRQKIKGCAVLTKWGLTDDT